MFTRSFQNSSIDFFKLFCILYHHLRITGVVITKMFIESSRTTIKENKLIMQLPQGNTNPQERN